MQSIHQYRTPIGSPTIVHYTGFHSFSLSLSSSTFSYAPFLPFRLQAGESTSDGLLRKTISKLSTEYRLQFIWPNVRNKAITIQSRDRPTDRPGTATAHVNGTGGGGSAHGTTNNNASTTAAAAAGTTNAVAVDGSARRQMSASATALLRSAQRDAISHVLPTVHKKRTVHQHEGALPGEQPQLANTTQTTQTTQTTTTTNNRPMTLAPSRSYHHIDISAHKTRTDLFCNHFPLHTTLPRNHKQPIHHHHQNPRNANTNNNKNNRTTPANTLTNHTKPNTTTTKTTTSSSHASKVEAKLTKKTPPPSTASAFASSAQPHQRSSSSASAPSNAKAKSLPSTPMMMPNPKLTVKSTFASEQKRTQKVSSSSPSPAVAATTGGGGQNQRPATASSRPTWRN